MRIFTISDTHWGHKNIIRYCERPFFDINEMDQCLIDNWNSVVGPTDLVIHVGDFAFADKQRMAEIRSMLNGTIHIVRGNHDKSPKALYEVGFDFVCESMIMIEPQTGKRILFQHHPIDPDNARHEILRDINCDYLVHGHCHNQTALRESHNSRNVSCENINYTPILLCEAM